MTANRLVKVVNLKTGQATSFGYDGLGRRLVIGERVAGASPAQTDYLWCGDTVCGARTAAGQVAHSRPATRLLTYTHDGPAPFEQARDDLPSAPESHDVRLGWTGSTTKVTEPMSAATETHSDAI